MRVGFIGWRGMVGSVLMDRMRVEGDFNGLECDFFSTSSPGAAGPLGEPLLNAYDVQSLRTFDVLLSCQGGDYTRSVVPKLRNTGWSGIWIDAASALRMDPDAVLVLDPLNEGAIKAALANGQKTFVGANCTVSLLLMGLCGLIRSGHVEWISTMSYQAASGAGAANLLELVRQMDHIGGALEGPSQSALDVDRAVADILNHEDFPVSRFGAPLAASAIPWIDSVLDSGQTREEWKSMAEANKILGRQNRPIPIDGICVRIGAMRCHAQAVTIKLDRDIPIADIQSWIDSAHPWTRVIANDQASTLSSLTPAAVAGVLDVPVGRMRKMKIGPEYLTAFTVGDQLLWGAAEPLRRMLKMVRELS